RDTSHLCWFKERISAISSLNLSVGKTPPLPWLAPFEIFISNNLTLGLRAFLLNKTGLKSPPFGRQPKYPDPISQTRSASYFKWYGVMPPSPVLWKKSPSRAPLLRAKTAGALKEP